MRGSKYFLICFFGAAAISLSFSTGKKDDKYKVIKVNGTIVVKSSGKSLTQGDEFAPATALDFKTPDSKATVISPDKGRFILTDNRGNGKKSNLIPAMNNVSSRSGAILNLIDLKNQFSGKYVILDQLEVRIGKDAYPMNEGRFFYIEYIYKGETIAKKLNHRGDTLVIDEAELLKVDGNPIEAPDSPEMTLKYRIEETNESMTISTFTPVFPDNASLKSEVQIIMEAVKSKSSADKADEVASYLNDFYGKPDKNNVKEWLIKEFSLKF